MYVLTCAEFDSETGACSVQVWAYQQGVLPPLSAAQGLELSGAIITVCAVAWGLKAVRRFIWPKA